MPVHATNPAAWSEDALLVAAKVWSQCYFTGWASAHHWAMTEHVFRTTVLKTSSRVRGSSVQMLDHDYVVSHVTDDLLSWGMKTEWKDSTRLRFADPARTVIEILDSPRIGGGIRHGAEVLVAYLDEHEPGVLVEYGDRLGNGSVFKRLGYLVEALGIDQPRRVDSCLERVSSGISALDPHGPAGGSRVMRWNLRINVTIVREGAS